MFKVHQLENISQQHNNFDFNHLHILLNVTECCKMVLSLLLLYFVVVFVVVAAAAADASIANTAAPNVLFSFLFF